MQSLILTGTSLSPAGIASLIIMVVCIVLFVIDKIPTSVVAVLGCAFMSIICGALDTSQNWFAISFGGFSNSIIMLLVGMFLVSDALLGSGAATIIGKFVNKLARNNERIMVTILVFATLIISAFLGNSATVPMMLTIVYGIVVADKENKYNFMHLSIPVGIAGVFGSSTTLIASTPQLASIPLLEAAVTNAGLEGNYTLGMFTFSLPGTIIALFGALFAIFIGYPLGKLIWGKRDPLAAKANIVAPDSIDLTNKENKRKLITSFVILIVMIILFVCTSFLDFLDVGAISMLCGVACILFKVTTFKKAYSTLNWNVCIWLAGCIGLGACLNASGAASFIASNVANALSGVPPFVFFMIFVLLAMVMSNFIANITAVIILLPLVLPIAIEMGINPLAMTIGIFFGANFAMLTPLANAFIGLTQVAGYKFKDYIIYGATPQVMAFGLVILFVPLFFPLTSSGIFG